MDSPHGRNLLLASSGRTNLLEGFEGKGWDKEVRFSVLKEAIQEIYQGIQRITCIPFADKDPAEWVRTRQAQLKEAGLDMELVPVEINNSPAKAIEDSEAILVGGGNTYELLNTLLTLPNFLSAFRKRISELVPYCGLSAGANIAGMTIHTTNDACNLPYAELGTWTESAMGIVPFNIKPHYIEPIADTESEIYAMANLVNTDERMSKSQRNRLVKSMLSRGQTKPDQIDEFHYYPQNNQPVIALHEGAILRVWNDSMKVLGVGEVTVFEKGKPRQAYPPGSDLSSLLAWKMPALT